MCGIAGRVSLDGSTDEDRALVQRMLRTLEHRGPDDQRSHDDAFASVGARRLAIIDLETGAQPVADERGSIWGTQNGEIYNYVELRDALIRSGHTLATHGDTETIVHLYEDDREGFVDQLRGMFAVALWDAGRRSLVLARDRLGKKPIYWRHDGDRLTYASELKALLVDPDLERRIDRVALAQYLQYQYVPAPRTIFEGIHKLPPATILTWDGGAPQLRRYWDPPAPTPRRRPAGEDVDACLEILRESVRLRLRSDVPVGVFLSGGIDSAIVTALMAEASESQVRSYTIGFDEPDVDELAVARTVAQRFGTNHTEEVVRLDAIGGLPHLAETFDEPFGDASALPTYRVARLAAADLKVVLTGDGGDEVFAGYERYRLMTTLEAARRLPRPARAIAGRLATLAAAPLRPRTRRRVGLVAHALGQSLDDAYIQVMSVIPTPDRRAMLAGDPIHDQDAVLRHALRTSPATSIERWRHADTLTYLPEDLMVKMDRATMANSLEARAPLLDHRLAEFAATLPADRKMDRLRTKAILRDVGAGLIPEAVLHQPKRGFRLPLDTWFRTDLAGLYRDVVADPRGRLADVIDIAPAAAMIERHQTGGNGQGHALWTVLLLALWAERWLPRSGSAS